ncbi:MAG: alpha-amylase family glycosyl hydrolase [Desulfobacteraceae bacterium]|jgi:1,4-alpha-glucan branching enzyme
MDSVSPSTQPGMGAIAHAAGASFRVWAPHADQVFVMGTFNSWSKTVNPLASEGNGYWSSNVPDATIGDQYKYVIIHGAKELIRTDPYARDVTSSIGNGIIHDPDFDWGAGKYRVPPLNEMVIYEMHIGTFNDQPGGPPGNFKSAIEKLPYLRDLGINAIEVMPAMEFAGGFSWGYNPAHLFAIESEYGGPKAFKEFIKAAHGHGIAVIFDVVYNHFGPSDLDIWQFDGWSEKDKGGIYFYNDWRCQTPWGETRPDYGREEVRQYIRDNAMMWLEEYQVDGLRWDMTAYIRNVFGHDNDSEHDIPEGWSLVQGINDEIKNQWPEKVSIAEDLKNNPSLTKDTKDDGAGFDAQWDAGFVHPVRESITTIDDQARNTDAVRDAILHQYDGAAFGRIIYTESHDEVANGKARVPEEISPGDVGSWFAKKRSTLGAAIVFTSPGVPMIFQGQEFLEDDWFHDKDPIDWSKKDKYKGILQLYHDLIRLRRNWYGNTRGLSGQHVNVHHVNKKDKVIAFHRWEKGGPGDSVIVVLNMANRSYDKYRIGFPRPGVWKARFNSDWIGYDPDFRNHPSNDTVVKEGKRDGMPGKGDIGIGPYSAVILSQD